MHRGSAAAAAAAIGCLLAPITHAADDRATQQQLQRLADRLQQLEQRNAELERQVKELKAAAVPAPAASAPVWGSERIEKVERQNADLQQRVAGLERPAEADEPKEEPAGPKFEAAVVSVLQNVNRRGSADGRSRTRANYRGDLTAEIPAGSLGEADAKAFAHLRLGQGTGVATLGTHSSTVNSTGFETAAGPDDSYAILAQAWYQLDFPLGSGGFNDQPGDRVELTIGKMDVFGFFDQNAAAGDEAAQFLNNAFVHNPLLDSGGDIAADAYGFAPGVRASYINVGDGSLQWAASLGVLASGGGANFQAGAKQPFVIGQFELSPMQINGEPRGTYRVYAWTNGRTADLAGARERHSGFGLSLDQKVGADWNLFGRYGRRFSGSGSFDRALTLGFEHGGRAWGRGSDALGLALGALHTDARLGGASGNERIAELYYRAKLNEHLELSPDFQLVQRAGGVAAAPTVRVLGVRASLGF